MHITASNKRMQPDRQSVRSEIKCLEWVGSRRWPTPFERQLSRKQSLKMKEWEAAIGQFRTLINRIE